MSWVVIGVAVAAVALTVFAVGAPPLAADAKQSDNSYEVTKSAEEWKKILTPEQFRILRRKGTERAYTGKYWDEKREGVYRCAGCNQPLFHSDHKFKSGTGWPSYYKPIAPGRVDTEVDRSFGMTRTEIVCSRCGGHLGHVFNDGPAPTGLRYCVNSASLKFEPAEPSKAPRKTSQGPGSDEGRRDKSSKAPRKTSQGSGSDEGRRDKSKP